MPRKFLFALILSFIVFQPLFASNNNLNILFLSSYAAELPWSASVQEGISEEITAYGKPVVLYNEYLDDMRLSDSLSIDEWDWYLSIKYRNAEINAIIIDADPATEIFYKIGDYFPGIPKLLIDPGEKIKMNEDIILLPNNDLYSVVGTFEMALKQKPKTENIYIVDGKVKTTEAYLEKLLITAEEHGYKPIVYQDFHTNELFKTLSSLPANSIIFYTLVRSDAAGNSYIPKEFLTQLCDRANAPVYVFWSSLMGSGAVGGKLVDGASRGKALFCSTLKLLEQGCADSDPSSLVTMMDAVAMWRNSISIRDVPQGTVYINTIFTFLKDKLETIIVILIIIFFSLGTTITLLFRLNKLNRMLNRNNQKLNSLIEEKHLLMQEMNHRIKNNLLILSGLCSMQIMDEENQKVIESLTDISLRIDTLSLIHETLSEQPEFSEIMASNYFEELLRQLNDSMNPDKDRIKLSTEFSRLSLSSKQITACGLILNELILNIFKYAFPDRGSGEISIRVFEENNYGFIKVSDTGIGLNENFNIETGSSLGMKIIRETVISLSGEIEHSGNSGTSFNIKFPLLN